jgi:hypothetical protein
MRTLILTWKVFSLITKVITIEKCKKALEKNGNKYTEEETIAIRYFVYQLIEIYTNNNENSQRYEKRNNLHKSVNRRTGK